MGKLQEEQLTAKIIGSAIEVHRQLGPGLLESSYQACLSKELEIQGVNFKKEVALPVNYKGLAIDAGYRMDFVIENKVIIEVKSVEKTLPVHEAQLLTYLKLSGLRVGLLINFNVPLLKKGLIRKVL